VDEMVKKQRRRRMGADMEKRGYDDFDKMEVILNI